ncbi:MAG: pseudouridine synthase [Planctomycetota bacterium]
MMSPKRPGPRGQKQRNSAQRESSERLQKVLAAAGVASRRESEELILAGRVEVDRQTVTVLGTRVDPSRQEIRVDGTVLPRPRYVYYLLNKPAGVVSTNRDPEGRPRVIDLVPAEKRLFTIGRLDRSSEGLIIVTNDGELTNQLTHPRYGIPKTYRAKVQGTPSAETLRKLRAGVHLAEGLAQVDALKVRGRHGRGLELEIVLTEGRNREIRRILAKVGHKVQQLRRTAIGDVRLGRLKTGEYRVLSSKEIRSLRQAAQSPNAGPGSRQGKSVSTRAKNVKARQAPARSENPAAAKQKPKSKDAQRTGAGKAAKAASGRGKQSKQGGARKTARKPDSGQASGKKRQPAKKRRGKGKSGE